jgi:beta-galactosidase
VRTRWATPDIWIRRTVKLDSVPASPALLIHHDEDSDVYINGKLVAQLKGYTTDYVFVPLSAYAAKSLRADDNTIAVHCHQTGGGQYIDVGIAEEVDAVKQ